MLVLVALGVMNLPAMIGVAVIIAVEKVWRFGETFARVVGVSALVYAALGRHRAVAGSGPRPRRCHERRHGNGRDGGEGPGAGGGDSLISRCQRFGEVALDGGAVEVAETASWDWKRRRRRLLVTTKTLENAIAAPASIGLSSPAAASGRAATL